MNFNEQLTKAFKERAELREAFIVEELKPFFAQDGDSLIMTEQLRCRLAEIKDFKQQVKGAFSELHDNFAELFDEQVTDDNRNILSKFCVRVKQSTEAKEKELGL